MHRFCVRRKSDDYAHRYLLGNWEMLTGFRRKYQELLTSSRWRATISDNEICCSTGILWVSLYSTYSHYNPLVRIIDLFSYSTYVVCVNFIYKWRDLQSTPNDRFFEKLFVAILFTLAVFARNLLRGNLRWNTFRISFWCLAWGSNPGFSSNNPKHYLLDHGEQNN